MQSEVIGSGTNWFCNGKAENCIVQYDMNTLNTHAVLFCILKFLDFHMVKDVMCRKIEAKA